MDDVGLQLMKQLTGLVDKTTDTIHELVGAMKMLYERVVALEGRVKILEAEAAAKAAADARD